jgi:hypothetical protein
MVNKGEVTTDCVNTIINPWVIKYLKASSEQELFNVCLNHRMSTEYPLRQLKIVNLVYQTLESLRQYSVEHKETFLVGKDFVWYSITLPDIGNMIFNGFESSVCGYGYEIYVQHTSKNQIYSITGDLKFDRHVLRQNPIMLSSFFSIYV